MENADMENADVENADMENDVSEASVDDETQVWLLDHRMDMRVQYGKSLFLTRSSLRWVVVWWIVTGAFAFGLGLALGFRNGGAIVCLAISLPSVLAPPLFLCFCCGDRFSPVDGGGVFWWHAFALPFAVCALVVAPIYAILCVSTVTDASSLPLPVYTPNGSVSLPDATWMSPPVGSYEVLVGFEEEGRGSGSASTFRMAPLVAKGSREVFMFAITCGASHPKSCHSVPALALNGDRISKDWELRRFAQKSRMGFRRLWKSVGEGDADVWDRTARVLVSKIQRAFNGTDLSMAAPVDSAFILEYIPDIPEIRSRSLSISLGVGLAGGLFFVLIVAYRDRLLGRVMYDRGRAAALFEDCSCLVPNPDVW